MSPRRADALLLAATVCFGLSFVVIKAALAWASPLAFVAVRFACAAAALAAFTRLRPFPRGGELAGGLLLGVLLAAGFAAATVGLVYTTPSRSAFITASSSVLAPVIAAIAVRERPRPAVVTALVLATLGIWLLTAPGAGGLNRGDWWTMLTAAAFGGQIVAVAALSRRYDAARLAWLEVAVTAAGVGLAMGLVEHPRIAWTPGLIVALAFCAVPATAVALTWQLRAQRHMSSARAALIFCAEPVVAAVTSWAATGERLSALQWAGGALVVTGMLATELGREREPAPPADPG